MNEKIKNKESKVHDGRTFDSPLVVPGYIDDEPERYIAEKPFDLTRFEYSLDQVRGNSLDFMVWFLR